MRFVKNKKAVFFTMIALFISVLVVAFFTTHDTYRYRAKSDSINARVMTVNEFVDGFERDLDREMFIGGYRAFLSMNSYIRQQEDFVDDFDSLYAEIFVNGSVNGTDLVLMKQEGQGADLNSWLVRINEESEKMDIHIDMEVNDVRVKQISPWVVEFMLDAHVEVEDMRGLAEWKFDKKYSHEFAIIGFEDPLYTVGTSDKVTNLVNGTHTNDFVSGGDASELNVHLMNSNYMNNSQAPSYLMRFTGNLSPSRYGIESMVNLEELDKQNIPIQAKSVIDYIYFSNDTTTDYCNITDTGDNLPSWFRVDDNHINQYEIDELSYENC